MFVRLLQIDAFADQVFRGNPAAVMPLSSWLPDRVLQALAAENNVSETAFYVDRLPPDVEPPAGSDAAYHLRWFTPAIEVDLCGHATLATAGHLFDDVHPDGQRLSFWTRSGWLHVTRGRRNGELVMDFPAEPLEPVAVGEPISSAALAALGVSAEAIMRATDLVFVLADETAVRDVTPDFASLSGLPVRGVVVTAPGDDDGVDFVSRWFGARAGVAEDPVTGSAHSQIAGYWAQRLGRARLTARQLSTRGGTVTCEVDGDRVRLGGTYRRYLDGTVTIPDDLL
ncbi:MAG TPA: PhzF family phenazine biosynthesis protein [Micromonosporaceae bacterium]|nr:PhzF family phenazine biosynthesis protein [Micromonosporaceae bacterium]